MADSRNPITHSNLIEILKAFGWQGIDDGICFGLCVMAMQAVLVNDYATFKDRLNFMSQFSTPRQLKEAVDQLRQIYKVYIEQLNQLNNSSTANRRAKIDEFLDEEEQLLISVPAFLESLIFHFAPEAFDPSIFNGVCMDQNVKVTSNLAPPALLANLKDPITEIYAGSVAGDADEISNFFAQLKRGVDQQDMNFASSVPFLIHSQDHTAMVIYHREDNHWQLFAPNHFDLMDMPMDLHTLTKHLVDEFTENDCAVISAVLYTTQEKEKIKPLTPCNYNLLDAAYYIDSFGETLLHRVVEFNDMQTAARLIEAGADCNQVGCKNGVSPLFLAIQKNNMELTKLFLTHHGDPNLASRSGTTPLFLAVQSGFLEIAALLLQAGAEVNERNPFGISPLFYTIKSQNMMMLRLLLVNQRCFTDDLLQTALDTKNIEIFCMVLRYLSPEALRRPLSTQISSLIDLQSSHISSLIQPYEESTLTPIMLLKLLGIEPEYQEAPSHKRKLNVETVYDKKTRWSLFESHKFSTTNTEDLQGCEPAKYQPHI